MHHEIARGTIFDWLVLSKVNQGQRAVTQGFGTILKPWRRGVHFLEGYFKTKISELV